MSSLWVKQIPKKIEELLRKLFDLLHGERGDWGVWGDWIVSATIGRGPFDLPAHIGYQVEKRIALGDGREDFWDREPEAINTEIAGWVEEARKNAPSDEGPDVGGTPVLPDQMAAPLETQVDNGKVEIRPQAPLAGRPGTSAMHPTLRAESRLLADRLRGQMPDAAALMEACHDALGEDDARTNIYAVGYFQQTLGAIGARVDETLLDDAAGRYAGFIVNLQRFLRQFDEWNAYVKTAQSPDFAKPGAEATMANSVVLADAIATHPDVVSEPVVSRMEQLRLALGAGQEFNPETLYGFTVSVANISVSIGSIALDAFNAAKPPVQKEIRAWFREYGTNLRLEAPKAAAKATLGAAGTVAIALIGGAASQLMGLSVSNPYLFGWVPSLLRYFGFGV